jgi:hypothetical protein
MTIHDTRPDDTGSPTPTGPDSLDGLLPAMLDYVVIDPDSCIRFVSAAVTARGTLPILQTAVGGYVEHVPAGDTLDGYANEEGLRLGLAPNPFGGLVHQRLTGRPRPWPLVGPLVFVGCDDSGDTVSITAEQRRQIVEAWAAVIYRR